MLYCGNDVDDVVVELTHSNSEKPQEKTLLIHTDWVARKSELIASLTTWYSIFLKISAGLLL